MTKHEYIESCRKNCNECGYLQYSRSSMTNRILVRCTKSDQPSNGLYYFQDARFVGMDEFFMDESNWEDHCPYSDKMMLMLFNTDEFKKASQYSENKVVPIKKR